MLRATERRRLTNTSIAFLKTFTIAFVKSSPRTFIYKALFSPLHAIFYLILFLALTFFYPLNSFATSASRCLSSPLFRGYIKQLRRPGSVGCRTEEALITSINFHSPRRLQVQQPLTPLKLNMSWFSSIYEAHERLHAKCCLYITAPQTMWTWWSDRCSFCQHCFVVAFLCVKRVWGCCFHVSTDECDNVSDVYNVIAFESCSIVPSTALFLVFMK